MESINLTNTLAGLAAIQRAMAGEDIMFTRLEIGDGVLINNDISNLNGLINKTKEYPLAAVQAEDSEIVRLRSNISNAGVTQDLIIREYGIYAKFANEIEFLFAYLNTGNLTTPLPNERIGRYELNRDFVLYIGNSLKVDFTSNGHLVYVSLKKYLNDIEHKLSLELSLNDLQNSENYKVGNYVFVTEPSQSHLRKASMEDDGTGIKGKNNIWWNIVPNTFGANKDDINAIFQKISISENKILELGKEVETSKSEIIKIERIENNSIPSSKLKIANDIDKIKIENLSEEVKSMMTGNTPVGPTLDDNSITGEKIAPGAVELSKLKNKPQQLISWREINIHSTSDNSKVITFKNDMVLQSQSTGRYIYFEGVGDASYTLAEGQKLVANWDEKNDLKTQDKGVLTVVPVASATSGTTLFTYVIGKVFKNIISKFEPDKEVCFWGHIHQIPATTSPIGMNVKFISNGNTTFQNLNTGNFVYSDIRNMEFIVNEGEKLILKHDFSIVSEKVANFNSKIIKKAISSPLGEDETLICSLVAGNFYKHIKFNEPGKLKTDGIFSWKELEIKGKSVKFETIVIQSLENGEFFYYNGVPLEIILNDGEVLYLDWDCKTTIITTTAELLKKVRVSEVNRLNGIPLITNISGKFYSEITTYNNYLNRYYNNVPTENVQFKINKSMKDIIPKFYKKLKTLKKDVTLVHLGDSISTNNYYTSQREDAKFRPPMMTEYCYASYLEELLRPSGQEYRRFDVDGMFNEEGIGTTKNLEYDDYWDWVATSSNNRPSITRVLEGRDLAVTYTIPDKACRCDYIYRTDCKNADSFTVIINKGNGYVVVFDEITNNWIEANGYVISAKEDESWVGGQQVRKSINQKRLKMKINRSLNTGDVTVKISNNGEGRLTYWGIQYSHREHMFNYLLQARGGHSISRIGTFEEWDVDYFRPDLILQQTCMLNENMDIANADGSAKNMNGNTPIAFADRFKIYTQRLLNKEYSPELIAFSMWWGTGNNPLDPITNEVWYGYDGEQKIAVADYFNEVDFMYYENNINHFNLFNILWNLGKEKALNEEKSILNATTIASGITGETWTIDGGHFNNKGSKLIFDIISNIFV